MKIKIIAALTLTLALLASISTLEPALSKPEQKISATADLRFPTVTQPERTINTNGEIRHVFGVRETFFVGLTLAEPFDGQTKFTGGVVRVLDFTTNFKTGNTVYHSTSLVWTLEGGSFEGMMQARQRLNSDNPYEESLVMRGSGIFAGCTLKLSKINNQPYTGLLLVSANAE
jgi:hypothetical protein